MRWSNLKIRKFQLAYILAALLIISLTVLARGVSGYDRQSSPAANLSDEMHPQRQDLLTTNSSLVAGFIYYAPIFMKPWPITVNPKYGINFVSSAEDPADDLKYANGKATGATINRWPIYWPIVEKSPGSFDWQSQDFNIDRDLRRGWLVNAILLGTPGFYTTLDSSRAYDDRPDQRGMFSLRAVESAVPVGLFEPVFSDGTDKPAVNKGINPNNKWANFVHAAVNRYKPGGTLARAKQWPSDMGLRYWEIWNEPDHPWFLLSENVADYARLLEVAYLAAKHADPFSTIIFGGLANYYLKPGFYNDVLGVLQQNSQAVQFGYYHDVFATHNYFDSWRSWYHVWRAGNTMADYGLDKPIWLNESGVSVWNDYPGPTWDPYSGWRATKSEQADFIIQSAFFARFAGADAIFHFQLYDGCGNQPQGTDFPPHDGSLCSGGAICAGDANGLFTNPTDAACFTQHPQPETARPNFEAFRVVTKYLVGVEPLWRSRPGSDDPYNGPQEWIALYQPETKQRIVGMWSRVSQMQTAVIEATGTNAVLIRADGTEQVIFPINGVYTINLAGATNQNTPGDPSYRSIGGSPVILIEYDPQN